MMARNGEMQYDIFGTSFSSPYAAGVLALWLEAKAADAAARGTTLSTAAAGQAAAARAIVATAGRVPAEFGPDFVEPVARCGAGAQSSGGVCLVEAWERCLCMRMLILPGPRKCCCSLSHAHPVHTPMPPSRARAGVLQADAMLLNQVVLDPPMLVLPSRLRQPHTATFTATWEGPPHPDGTVTFNLVHDKALSMTLQDGWYGTEAVMEKRYVGADVTFSTPTVKFVTGPPAPGSSSSGDNTTSSGRRLLATTLSVQVQVSGPAAARCSSSSSRTHGHACCCAALRVAARVMACTPPQTSSPPGCCFPGCAVRSRSRCRPSWRARACSTLAASAWSHARAQRGGWCRSWCHTRCACMQPCTACACAATCPWHAGPSQPQPPPHSCCWLPVHDAQGFSGDYRALRLLARPLPSVDSELASLLNSTENSLCYAPGSQPVFPNALLDKAPVKDICRTLAGTPNTTVAVSLKALRDAPRCSLRAVLVPQVPVQRCVRCWQTTVQQQGDMQRRSSARVCALHGSAVR